MSYYCKEHVGQDANLTFNLNQRIISFKVNNIVSTINTIQENVAIHDCFRNNANQILYLVTGTLIYYYIDY